MYTVLSLEQFKFNFEIFFDKLSIITRKFFIINRVFLFSSQCSCVTNVKEMSTLYFIEDPLSRNGV